MTGRAGLRSKPSAAWTVRQAASGAISTRCTLSRPGAAQPRGAAQRGSACGRPRVTAHAGGARRHGLGGSTRLRAWWVEFGPTTAYGQMTAPVLDGRREHAPEVTAALHRAVAATTPTTRASSVTSRERQRREPPTLSSRRCADPRAVRIAAAGDIACDPDSPPSTAEPERRRTATSSASPMPSWPATTTPYSHSATCSTTAARRLSSRRSYDPSWGRLKAITHPAVGNHEYGSPGAGALLPVLRCGSRSPGSGVLLLRSRFLAPDRAQLELRPGSAAAPPARPRNLAAGRSRGSPGRVHARLLAPPALLVGSERAIPSR